MGAVYLNAFIYFNFALATVALVLRYLALFRNGNRTSAGQWATFVLMIHIWFFFAVSVVLRGLFGYRSPTVIMSAWASAVFLHVIGALAMDSYYHLKRAGYWAQMRQRLPGAPDES